MKRNILIIVLVAGVIAWSCSKIDSTQSQQLGLKESVAQGTTAINEAVSSISSSTGFKILTADEVTTSKDASATAYNDSITLSLIKGIYDYQVDTTIVMHHSIIYPYRLFKKTGTSNEMIVNLPEALLYHPGYLHHHHSDSTLKNNATISASDYHFYYNSRNNLDYKLAAGLAINSSSIGSFEVTETANSRADQSNSATYTFTDGYAISTTWQTGDTATSTYALLKDNSPLFKETTLFIKTDSHRREKLYDLVVGDVEIKKGYADSIQVYLNGVLQKTKGVKITDSTEATGSICYRKDILITYDDGTTATLSSLLSSSLEELKTLFTSLHEMYFAENVIDYIAVNIYFNSR